MTSNNYAVIMAGGVGSRFWPISRTSHPKQFIDILGTGRTLIQNTFDRLRLIVPERNIFIVTNESYVGLVKEQLPTLLEDQILSEPVMKNTAPCIAYACFKILCLNPNANIVVAPSDHLIIETAAFTKAVLESFDLASSQDCLITLGIKPSRPDTGYGYIKMNDKGTVNGFHPVERFTEKPDSNTAKSFLRDGNYLWNSGIFIWSSSSIYYAFEKYCPDVFNTFAEGLGIYNTKREKAFVKDAFLKCPSISIDYAILESAENVYVLPADFGWSDLGTWSSIYGIAEKDVSGNATITSDKILMYESSNCIVNVPGDKLVILSQLNDYIVVESNNTLLICPKGQEQEVKQFVFDVKNRFGVEYV